VLSQLEEKNRLLLARDRILEANSPAASRSLTLVTLDQAVNTAPLLGKSLILIALYYREFNSASDPLAVWWSGFVRGTNSMQYHKFS